MNEHNGCAKVEMTLPSDPQLLCVVRVAAERMATRVGFDEQQVEQIGLAVNEALANVIEHGYEGATDCPMEIVLVDVDSPEHGMGLRIAVRDRGRQVDPTVIRSRELNEVRPGGLGVHIIRTVMDDVEYVRRSDGGMEMTMTKWVVP